MEKYMNVKKLTLVAAIIVALFLLLVIVPPLLSSTEEIEEAHLPSQETVEELWKEPNELQKQLLEKYGATE